ncbi:hypothetical protein PsorP6_009562 [Peronosclerospora sorghi]|uniref:Uncharacterized protein n=1 Tax=Peronosclerospora sorghi TaxID=230839 RepID=A0ACC0VXW5_9STRA|nr:hypothetical protein PsorP6_009562 [Peronosclerospora sorghi]
MLYVYGQHVRPSKSETRTSLSTQTYLAAKELESSNWLDSKFVVNKNDDNLQIIEKQLKKRQFNQQLEWLVQWHVEAKHEASWEREKDIKYLSHWHDLVDDFKTRQRLIRG